MQREEVGEVYVISGEFDIMAILELDPDRAIDLVAKKLLGIKGKGGIRPSERRLYLGRRGNQKRII
ncbi:MAG: hypothetical protein JRI46_11760 [Deltaproteobacteria bacterium]|nr:hypothetical protein [Deltaproteobacteria bacterium]